MKDTVEVSGINSLVNDWPSGFDSDVELDDEEGGEVEED